MSDLPWLDAFERYDFQRRQIVISKEMAGFAALLSPLPSYPTAPRRAPEGPARPWLKEQPGTKQRKRWLQKQARKRNRS